MLGNLDPIIIFQLYKQLPATEATLAKIPLAAQNRAKTTFSIVPIYLDENLTGLQIDGESKNIDVTTDTNSTTDGSTPVVTQKALGSITTINLKAKSGSVGLTIMLALMELLLDKVTSQEYEITYMHGPILVYGGLIHSFSYELGSGNDDLCRIKLELAKGRPKLAKSVEVAADPSAVRLGSTGTVPPPGASTVSAGSSSGQSVIQPGLR